MFIHRIFTRIHKLKTPANINSLNLSNNYVNRQISTRPTVVKNIIYTSTRRNLFQNSRKQNIEKLKLSDNIPNNYELVYRCTMSSYLYAAQIFATAGVIFVCVIGIFINLNTKAENNFQINIDYIDLQNLLNSEIQFVAFSVGLLVINIAVMLLVSKFPIRIYFNKDSKKYIGILHGKIPQKKIVLKFTAGEVIHKPINSVLPWGEFRYKLKNGKNIIMLDHYFRKPDDMNIMLGYTKL